MPFETVLTPDDLKKGDLVEPGWYPAELVEYSEDTTKDQPKNPNYQPSLNLFFQFKIIQGKHKGVSPRKMYNEKALGFAKELWAALEVPFIEGVGYKLSTRLLEGIAASTPKIDIYIKRGKNVDKGTEFNEIDGYRKFGSGAYAKSAQEVG